MNVDPDSPGCLVTCAGCGGSLAPHAMHEISALVATDRDAHYDLMERAVALACANGVAVTTHLRWDCERCGGPSLLRITFLNAPPAAAA